MHTDPCFARTPNQFVCERPNIIPLNHVIFPCRMFVRILFFDVKIAFCDKLMTCGQCNVGGRNATIGESDTVRLSFLKDNNLIA